MKSMKKRCFCLCLSLMTAFLLSGCSLVKKFSLTTEEEALCVQYAANTVLKHDKNYIDRMRYVEIETEPETEPPTEWITEPVTQSPAQPDGSTSPAGGTTAVTYQTMDQIFQIPGIQITPAGYEVTGSYPSDGQQLGMSMVAISGSKLLVMKFQVTNVSGADIPLDLMNSGAAYKGVLNGTVKMNVQVTALLDAFNTFNGVLNAGESRQLVLVFQADENDTANISSVELNVTYNNLQGTVVIN